MRFVFAMMAILGVLVQSSVAVAQDWPTRPIRWIVPFAGGGSTDVLARVIGEKLSVALGQPVIIENRPGGDTMVATAAMAQAAPDGYTFGYIVETLAIHEAASVKRTYNPTEDLAHVIQLATLPVSFLVNAEQVPQKTLQELVSHAKADPRWLTFASIGAGSPLELRFRQFLQLAGIEALIVPYRGGTPALQDVAAGHIKSTFRGGTNEADLFGGKVRSIAVSPAKRVATAPNVPTFAEQGFPEFSFRAWYGLVVPKKTPPQIIERLNKEVNLALESDEIKAVFKTLGMEPAGGSAEDLAKLMDPEVKLFRKIITDNKITF